MFKLYVFIIEGDVQRAWQNTNECHIWEWINPSTKLNTVILRTCFVLTRCHKMYTKYLYINDHDFKIRFHFLSKQICNFHLTNLGKQVVQRYFPRFASLHPGFDTRSQSCINVFPVQPCFRRFLQKRSVFLLYLKLNRKISRPNENKLL